MKTLQSDSVGVYAGVGQFRFDVIIEVNDGDTSTLVCVTPEEARILARELTSEADEVDRQVAA